MSKSRTKNVSVNVGVALACQIVNLVINFVSRTVFIKTLGADYLGINGLFTNVLTILSFAELGIGNAIIFSMYKPLATDDTQKLGSLMDLYKRAYRTIGIIVAAVGVCVIPFLNQIIRNKPNVSESMVLLYLLFLTNTVSSYFFVYKKSIIIADQKNYIVLVLTEGIHVLQIFGQIIFLYLTHSFIIYLLIQIGCTLIGNMIASVVADRLYPFLRQTAKPLDKDESKGIFKNVRALALYKFGSVILNGTDNILVSAMVGVTEVGYVSNYVLLNTSCNAILGRITEAFTASVGNLNAVENDGKKYDIFNKLFFITQWLYGFASIGLITVASSLIRVWIGSDYILDPVTVVAIVAGFYVQGVHFAAYTYRTTLGLFVQAKSVPIIAAVINIILSVVLCKWIGLAGIFIATPVARLITTGIMDPVLIYKKVFRKNPIIYYAKYFSYIIMFILIGLVCQYCVTLVSVGGWIGVLIKIGMVSVVYNGIMLALFGRSEVVRDLWTRLKSIVMK